MCSNDKDASQITIGVTKWTGPIVKTSEIAQEARLRLRVASRPDELFF